MGGVMMYWYQREESFPDLSRYGSDFCSAPGQYFVTHPGLLLAFTY
jgi:hypothetical protein